MRRRPEATKRYMLQRSSLWCAVIRPALFVGYSLGDNFDSTGARRQQTAQDDGMQPFSVLKE